MTHLKARFENQVCHFRGARVEARRLSSYMRHDRMQRERVVVQPPRRGRAVQLDWPIISLYSLDWPITSLHLPPRRHAAVVPAQLLAALDAPRRVLRDGQLPPDGDVHRGVAVQDVICIQIRIQMLKPR
jgi:hypothetical protein